MNNASWKDPRMAFGFLLLLIFAFLIAMIALGKVQEDTSYGLMPLLVALSGLGAGWAGWAFGHDKPDDSGKNGDGK